MIVQRAMHWILAGALCVAAGGALAQAGSAGSLIVVVGDVRIVGGDGVSRAAKRGDEVREGDTIVTGHTGLAQIRMSDRAAISVRADSQLRLDAYKYSDTEREGSSFMSLLAGGFRTITGFIARGRKSNYRVRTEMVTIGVRGTHFEVVHLLKESGGAAAGTYNRVYDGLTTMQGRIGPVLQVGRDQTGFVALTGKLPPVIVPTPPAIFRKPAPVPIVDPRARDEAPGRGAPARKLGRPMLNPLDAPRTGDSKEALEPSLTPLSPATTTISPTLSEPVKTESTITTEPTKIESTTTILSPTKIESTTSTILSPTKIESTTTTISPTTTTISPTTTTISPTTTTISPTTTTISPTTTTISPTKIESTTTTIKR